MLSCKATLVTLLHLLLLLAGVLFVDYAFGSLSSRRMNVSIQST